MATRKPLFMDAEGYSVEMPAADDIVLGGLSITPGNLNLNATGKIVGMADGVNDADGVNKGQLDSAIINGGSIKELLVHEEQLSDPQGILAAMALFFSSNPVSGDTISITDGTLTRVYGAAAGGDVQYAIGATPADTMANFVAAVIGDGTATWGAYFTSELDSINAAGVVVITEDVTAVGDSTSRIYGTWVTQANCQVVEYAAGGDVDADYRENTTANLPGVDPAEGRFGLRRQQADLEDGEIHFVRNDDSTYAWDDADNVWQVLSGAASIPDATAASGGGIKGKITVDSDKGLAVASGVLSLALHTTNPGLEFESTSKGLQVLIDPNDGLEKGAAGIGVKIVSTDRLSTGASGLDVVGLPSLFEIAGTAVGATVTAANLDTLTDTSNADSLHTHTPPTAVDEAKRTENDITAGENLTAGDPVYFDGNDSVGKADAAGGPTYPKARIFGVCKSTTASAAAAPVVSDGEVAAVGGGGWTANDVIYLASGGGLTNTRPTGGVRVVRAGFAMNANDLFVSIMDYGRSAA